MGSFNKNRNMLGFVTRQTVKQKQRFIIATACLLVPIIAMIVMYTFKSEDSLGAATGDYRSKASGNWSDASTWQRYNGSSWANALLPPSNADKVITIQSPHIVTVTLLTTADQVEVSSGATLRVNSGVTLSIANGTGTDLTVEGTVENAGTITNTGASISFASSGLYRHAHTTSAGAIPAATWNAGSTCEIRGYTSNSSTPSGLGQTFHHFIWNCTSQTQHINLNGGLTTINGNLTIASTGTRELRLGNSNYTITVAGNFSQTGGTLTLTDNGSSTSNLNIAGNWSHTGGTIGAASGSISTIVFNKSGSQTFTASGNTVSANVSFAVNSGSTLVMGTNIMTGGVFTLNSGGTLSIGSPAGITSSGATGNIQVSGARTFNAAANYIYNASSAQVTGNGLPATVNNLQCANSSGLSLTSTVTVAGILTLTNGCITTGMGNLIDMSNAATNSISGYSSSKYIVGQLRRAVNASGTYDFPIGTSSHYELATVRFYSQTGVSNLTATFVNSNPLTGHPLDGIAINAHSISKALDYGYWTITPNSPMTGGNYTVTLKEKGYTEPYAGRYYCVLKRPDSNSDWISEGTHHTSTQSESSGVVTAARSGLTSFSDFAICYGEFMGFTDPVVISGTDGAVNCIYKFPDVLTGIDAWVQILELNGGATLSDIDHFSDGYDEAWQPFVNGSGADANIRWRVTFKKGGTSTDTTLATLELTAVDVDGGSNLKEYIEASNIYSYAVDPSTVLVVTPTAIGYRATGANATISDIDTAHHEAMVQMNYRNVNSFIYRTGINYTGGGSDVRQFSLFFQWFMEGNTALPVELMYFNAIKGNGQVDLKWATASEENNDYFTVERSDDGRVFEKILTQRGQINSSVTHTYNAVDRNPIKGRSYYRLKQTDLDGKFTYSNVATVTYDDSKLEASMEIRSVTPSMFNDHFILNYFTKESGQVDFSLVSLSGQIVDRQTIEVTEGNNSFEWNDNIGIQKGIYLAVLRTNTEKAVMKIVKQ